MMGTLTKNFFETVITGSPAVPGQAYSHRCDPPNPQVPNPPSNSGGGSACLIVPVYGPCPPVTGPVEGGVSGGQCLLGFEEKCS